MRSIVHRTALAAGLTLAAACADAPTGLDLEPNLARNGKGDRNGQGGAGTTLVAEKTATGFNERQTEYDWSIEKRVLLIMGEGMAPEPSTTTTRIVARSVTESPENVKWIDYEIVATRGADPTVTTVSGVRGEICVANTGERPTEGLAIRDVVQRKVGGAFEDVASAPVDVSEKPVLAAGERHCYPYEISLPAAPGEYRNTAFVTITNHSGHLGEPFGPAFNGGGIKAGFSIPSTRTEITLDERAHIWDPAPTNVPGSYQRGGCAALWPLFFCTAAGELTGWFAEGSQTFEYMVDIGNLYACGDDFTLRNTVALTESGHGDFGPLADRRFTHATITITTGDCPPATGTVRSAAFWSSGTGWPPHRFWGNTFRIQDFPFFDTGATWLEQVRLSPSTLYERLAREYIAATLNVMSRAPAPQHVLDARSAVGHYFASWPEQRALVTDAQLEEWRSILASYNASGGT